jgi:hypothetical protein
MEQAEYEENVPLDVGEWLVRHTVVITVVDPENVFTRGFRIRMAFGNEYFARLLVKRCRENFAGLAEVSTKEYEHDDGLDW